MPNHWIRLLAPVRFEDDKAMLEVFTWGKNTQSTIDEDVFDQMTYEIIIGATKDGVL